MDGNDDDRFLCWRSIKSMMTAMLQGNSSVALKDEEHADEAEDESAPVVTFREWSTDSVVEMIDRGTARDSRRMALEPISVDEYLPIESPYTDIDLGTIIEGENEGVEIDVDEEESLVSVEYMNESSHVHMDRVESIIQHLMQRQDEICSYMGETIISVSKSKKTSISRTSSGKAHQLLEHQKRISILFAESVKKFATRLDRKVSQSKRQAEEIKRLKAELAGTKRILSESNHKLMHGSPVPHFDADDFEQSSQPVSVLDEPDHYFPDVSIDDGFAQRDTLERIIQEKENEVNEAKDVIDDLIEQLRDAEQEIEFCIQREREGAMAMQAVLNCKIADQRGEIDELKEQLKHKTVALKKTEATCWHLQSRRERKSGKLAITKVVDEDTSISTADLSESMAESSESAAEYSESMEDSSETSFKDFTLRFY